MPWTLKRTVQCAKCPWRKSTNPHDIPNGYSVERHKALKGTIAEPSDLSKILDPAVSVMACHEEHSSICIGWLLNQLGPGNNIQLRLYVRQCENISQARVVGSQHERFEDTLPGYDD